MHTREAQAKQIEKAATQMLDALLQVMREAVWSFDLPVPGGGGWIIPGGLPVMGQVRDAITAAIGDPEKGGENPLP